MTTGITLVRRHLPQMVTRPCLGVGVAAIIKGRVQNPPLLFGVRIALRGHLPFQTMVQGIYEALKHHADAACSKYRDAHKVLC